MANKTLDELPTLSSLTAGDILLVRSDGTDYSIDLTEVFQANNSTLTDISALATTVFGLDFLTYADPDEVVTALGLDASDGGEIGGTGVLIQLKGGTTSQREAATPEERELVVDTDENTVYLGDGSTLGGVHVAYPDLDLEIAGELGTGVVFHYSTPSLLIGRGTTGRAKHAFRKGASLSTLAWGEVAPSAAYGSTSLIFHNLINVSGAVNFTSASYAYLTTLSCPVLAFIGGNFTLFGTVLTSINFSALEGVGGNVSLTGLTGMSSLSLPVLEHTGNLTVGWTTLTALSLPSLVSLNGTFTTSSMSALTLFSAPVLQYVAGQMTLDLGTNVAITALGFPALEVVGNSLTITHTKASSATFSSLISVGATFRLITVEMVTVTLNAGLKKLNGDFIISGAKLSAATVNHILTTLATLDGTNGTTALLFNAITLNGGTSAGLSQLTAPGLAAKAKLEAAPFYCSVNLNA